MRSANIEERFIHSAIEAKVTLVRGNPVVEEAQRLRTAGDVEGAFALLEAESRKKPDDPDVGVAFWDTATSLQRPDAAAAALARAIRRLSAGDSLPTALGYWTELKGLVPGALVDPTTLLRFVPALRKEARSAEASRALRDAVDPANRGLMPPQAVRVAELARESDPAVALAAAKLALASPDLPAPTRARLEQLAGLEGTAAVAPPVPVPVPVPAPKPASAPAPAAKAPGDRSLELEFDPDAGDRERESRQPRRRRARGALERRQGRRGRAHRAR